jgi:hypothetical protein
MYFLWSCGEEEEATEEIRCESGLIDKAFEA